MQLNPDAEPYRVRENNFLKPQYPNNQQAIPPNFNYNPDNNHMNLPVYNRHYNQNPNSQNIPPYSYPHYNSKNNKFENMPNIPNINGPLQVSPLSIESKPFIPKTKNVGKNNKNGNDEQKNMNNKLDIKVGEYRPKGIKK